ncbi:MAG: uL15 family ribosomal protein [Clostridia bacterium]|nr:uL15 family ribosomal protein [Clostridia bacterium]
MSENKKRISKAQVIVLISIVLAIAAVIILSLVLHERERTAGECCPWCFGACPWCWIVVDIAVILIYAAVLLAMTAVKNKVAEAVAVAAPVSRHRAQRDVSIPRQKKHREHHHGHTLRHAKQYDATVSLQQLMQAFPADATVNIEILKGMGLVPVKADGYKVLVADNEKMDRPLNIHATSFSAQAKHAILHAGGKAIKVYH